MIKRISSRLLAFVAFLLVFGLLLSAVGCGRQEVLTIRADLSGGVNSLDPQFATDGASRTIIAGAFEGLLRRDESGQPVPGAAESYTVSPDGLVYTFTLRADGRWSDGKAVTAADFVFALRRLFHPQVPSPYAGEFMVIENADKVLSGELSQNALGVRARDARTLEIRLTQRSPLFPETLCGTAAMPCNEEFFTGTRARYGLEAKYLKCNGVYRLDEWVNDKYISLAPNEHYYGAVAERSEICFYTGRVIPPEKADEKTKAKSALELFNEGKSDVYLATAEELPRITAPDAHFAEVKNRVWQLVFNTAYPTLSSVEIRRGLAEALDRGGFAQRIPEMYGLAGSVIPESARPAELPFPVLLPYDREGARAAADAGLAVLEEEALPPFTILMQAGTGLETVAGYLQRQWMDALAIYVNLEMVDAAELRERLAAGDFSLALVPQEASGEDCGEVLGGYTAPSVRNHGRWKNPDYDALLENAVQAGDKAQAINGYRAAEQLLIDQAAAVPLFTQSSYYAFSKGTQGVAVVGGVLDFTNAIRRG